MTVNTMRNTPSMIEGQKTKTQESAVLRWLPTGLLLLAAVCLFASIAFPYWRMELEAPQYPQGLQMRVFVNRMTGDEDPILDDVKEIDGLNHYIGMESLYNAAKIERAIALPAVIIMGVLLVISAFWKWRWSWLLALPLIGFPFIFLADLGLWMRHYGQNLDPYAPLSSSIGPFTPPVIGVGVIGNFRTIAYIETGWFILVIGSALVVVALVIKWISARGAGNVQTP